MSPETGPSTVPLFDRGGRFVENSILSLPDGHQMQVRGNLRESIMRNSLATLVSVPALLYGAAALAQSDTTTFDQIIVTGARSPLASEQLGSASSVITRADIEQRQAHYVTELLRAVPGFAISHTGVTGSQTQVRVRGAEANHVLVLIDGVRANDPATGDEFHWEFLTTNNIERIEIVRGPQSSLWGSDAVAAVVQIITRSGQQGGSFDGWAESGSFGTANIGAGGSLGNDRWSLSAGVEQLATDGGNVSREGNENDDADITSASLSARLRASDALTANLSLRATDAYSQFDPVDFFVTGLPVDGDVATEADNLYARLALEYGAEGSRFTQHFTASYFSSDNQNLVDGVQDTSSASDRRTLAWQTDIRLQKDLLSLAVEHEQTDFEQRGAIVFGDPNQDQRMRVTSLIADYQGRSYERLSWLLSARFDNNSDFDDAVTGRASLAYALTADTRLRGAVGTGHKNPTFTDLFGYFPGQFVGNPNLKPEHSTSFDIGIDHSMLDGALLLQAGLFKQDLEDEINGFVFDPQTFLATAENETTTSKRSGVELGARWQLEHGFELAANYTYTDAEQNGAQEIRRPRHAGSIALDYRSPGERLNLALAADYSGSSDDEFFPPFPEPARIVTLDSYWLVDMTLQWQLSDSTSVYARGTNLLDEEYEQVYGYRTLGRAGYLGLRVNFGP